MTKNENYNEQLKDLYFSKIQDLDNMFCNLKDTNYSSPLLLHAFEDYTKAPIKLMIFGQETNKWDKKLEYCDTQSIEYLINKYKNFENGTNYKHKGGFWSWVYKFTEMLYNTIDNEKDKSLILEQSIIWNNILKFGKLKTKGKPSSQVIKLEMENFNVIPKELEILKPQVCIFFTGPNYDKYIKSKFNNVCFEAVDGYKTRQLAKLRHEYLPKYSYRTYHPGYGRYLKENGYLNIFSAIINDIKIQMTKS